VRWGWLLVFLLLVYSAWLTVTQYSLENKIEELRGKISSLDKTNKLLMQERESWHNKYSNCMVNLSLLSETCELQIEGLKDDIELLEARLNHTLKRMEQLRERYLTLNEVISREFVWLQNNALYPYTTYPLERKCLEGRKLNAPCVSLYFLKDYLGLQYIGDTSDELYSIDEILARKGGDCDDFSLIYASILRKYVGKTLVAWKPGNREFKVYETSRYIYTLKDAEPVEIPITDNISIVCYYTNYPDLGHCVVGIDDNLVEPQDGEYLGKIGKDVYFCNQTCGNGGVISIYSPEDVTVWYETNGIERFDFREIQKEIAEIDRNLSIEITKMQVLKENQ
jgi:hypothetical protein